ncbi:hypothetical protein QTN25_010742 [Entamoeba marina]
MEDSLILSKLLGYIMHLRELVLERCFSSIYGYRNLLYAITFNYHYQNAFPLNTYFNIFLDDARHYHYCLILYYAKGFNTMAYSIAIGHYSLQHYSLVYAQ